MSYYVFRIAQGHSALFKNLELLKEFATFKEAQNFAKETRTQQAAADNININIKVIFANNQLDAEEKLMEVREQPILREWEK